ncbi:gcn5-related n-acetyltransferase [Grosmannia clavigera kw1407]|uniref:N-alpha-acetyltransferase 40 n=1 Tax=Grosmannia clavigera (strain kw1407 / UAMH 11150) TaxID=655863 RepID=F0XAB5_GROCL|nr:gcn5-related n-acetyltransferase [Grosmannia clavigera kw1407]EFX05426.1 gcn5-related n-acetyltransferase [Grosmannia clavigera kw1407]
MAVKKRRRAATSPIERANQKNDEDFIASYLAPGAPLAVPWTARWTHPQTGAAYDVSLARSGCVGEAALETCFALIEETSRKDYDGSQQKWQPADKRREMREADLRYILVQEVRGEEAEEKEGETKERKGGQKEKDQSHQRIRGFTSLMPAYEEGQPVVYCYEIHLKPELQGTGLAGLLLGFLYTIAYNLPLIAKVMLTCFLSNERALRFYRKQHFVVDPIAPEIRQLRGKTVVPDYTIMSKAVRR